MFRLNPTSCIVFLFFIFITQYTSSQSRATISGTISDQFGILPGAKVSIEGSDLNTTTDINGNYMIEVDEGEYVISVAFIMYTSVSKNVVVKTGENIIQDFILETGFSMDQPISLGTRAKPSSQLQITAAVDIISPQDISNSSQIELSHILQYLVPSFHSTHQTIADGTDHIDPATLRGLGPDQILILVNGKRRHSSSLLNVNGTVGRGTVGTDFNAIPVAAIERVEILRDGAASQYGSDAIAGVINIILKKQTEYISVDNNIRVTTAGDGLTTYSAANFGLNIGEKGYVNVTAEYRKRGAINRAGDYTGTVYTSDLIADQDSINANGFYNQTGYNGRRVMQVGSAETQNLALTINGEIEMSDKASFYMHGGRNYREGKAAGFYRFPKDEEKVVLELFPNGFSPQILTDIQDDYVVAGIRGQKNDWNLDFSHAIGINTLDYTVNNSNNASLGASSPRTFYTGGFVYNLNTTNFDVSRSFDWLEGTNIGFGAELRVENYQIIAGEEDSYIDGGSTYFNGVEDIPRLPGSQVFPGIQPENELDRFRTNSSVYIDLESNVTDKLLFKVAGRYEIYNDFGSQAIWKLSSRYRFNENFTIRGGYSTGFRAPSLHQVYFQNISTQFAGGESLQVGTFNNQSAIATEVFEIKPLTPELSDNFSVGVSFKINKNIAVNSDYYLINIKDRIVLSGKFEADKGFETELEPFNVSAAQFFTNAIDSRTSGVDARIVYKNGVGIGKIDASMGVNFTKTRVLGAIKVSESLVGEEDVLFNREEIGRVESAQPNYKINSLFSYEFNKFKIQMQNTLFGEVKYIHPEDGDATNWVLNEYNNTIETRDQTFSPKIVTDLGISYQANDYIKCTIGGNNIFNVFPDKHIHSANTSNGSFIYSRRVQQFGVSGSNYYLRVLLRL